MLIIVEGCDGVGKTPLVNELRRLMPDAQVLHRGPPVNHPLEEYELPLEDYRPLSSRSIICDRWHWGEAIYGPLRRGIDRLGAPGMTHVNLFLESRGALQVWLDAPNATIRENLYAKGEWVEDIVSVAHAYRSLVDVVRRHSVVRRSSVIVDWTQKVDSLIAVAARRASKVIDLATIPTYVGPRWPEALLLGEKRGEGPTRFRRASHASAFVPYHDTSGWFLFTALDMAAESMPPYGLANANEIDLAHAYEVLGRPRLVALGHVAAECCVTARLPYTSVPHPQHVRRFHHRRQKDYGTALVQLACGEESSWRA